MNPGTLTSIAIGAAAAAGGVAWGAVSPQAQLFGPALRRTDCGSNLALTFDDGPNPAATPQLLDVLERYSARATFFVIGQFARACPDLMREIAARGHLLGNHSDTHPNMFFLSPRRIREELDRCQETVAAATGCEPPRWMRPPYGYRSPLLEPELRRAGLHMVMWSKICRDWKPQPPEQLIRKLAGAGNRGAGSGDIVLLHDGDHRGLGADRSHVIAALEYWLPRWRDGGAEFVTIGAPE